MIRIRNMSKSFGKQKVLQGINLDLSNTGKITAILGPNGSGKTTLIKSLLGMVIPDHGEIEVFERNVRNSFSYRSKIGYLPQIARFPENLTVQELIELIKDIRGAGTDEGALIERFGLTPFLDKRLSHLSGGTKQKVNLTLAFMYDNPLLMLDEPSSGLDPLAMQRLRELLDEQKEQNKMILVTTHIMSLVEEIADEIIFLLDGHIHFQGTKLALKEKYQETNVERAIARILETTDESAVEGSAPVTPYTEAV